MSENPHAPNHEDAPTEDEEAVARRSRDTGGDAPAAASIEEREALAAESDEEDAATRDEPG